MSVFIFSLFTQKSEAHPPSNELEPNFNLSLKKKHFFILYKRYPNICNLNPCPSRNPPQLSHTAHALSLKINGKLTVFSPAREARFNLVLLFTFSCFVSSNPVRRANSSLKSGSKIADHTRRNVGYNVHRKWCDRRGTRCVSGQKGCGSTVVEINLGRDGGRRVTDSADCRRLYGQPCAAVFGQWGVSSELGEVC